MPLFRAVELVVDTASPTGKVEYYEARGKKAAFKKLLYTRRLKNGRCRLGPTGLVVSCGKTAWIIMRRTKDRKGEGAMV